MGFSVSFYPGVYLYIFSFLKLGCAGHFGFVGGGRGACRHVNMFSQMLGPCTGRMGRFPDVFGGGVKAFGVT